jgi:hypothetical protein
MGRNPLSGFIDQRFRKSYQMVCNFKISRSIDITALVKKYFKRIAFHRNLYFVTFRCKF